MESDWGRNGIGLAGRTGGVGLEYKRRGPVHLAPLFASDAPRPPASTGSAGVQGVRGKESPLGAVIPRRELLSSIVLSHLFTLFLAILGKLGLVDILVRLTNKLYPMQHYFGVYAWMFL